jgi:hypothetical protein
MSNILSNTMHAAKDGVESAQEGTMRALGAAKHGVEAAEQSTMHAVSSALATILKGVTATAGIVTTLRSLDRDDGLAWFGLARRRSPLVTVAVFGAGAVVGAGIALLFAPTLGADLRRMIAGRLQGDGPAAKAVAGAHDAVKKIETEVEGAAEAAASAVKDAIGASPPNGKSTHA